MSVCFRCGKEFYKDGNLTRHLQVTKKCHPDYLDIDREELIKASHRYKDDFEKIKNRYENKSKLEDKIKKMEELKKEIDLLKNESVSNHILNTTNSHNITNSNINSNNNNVTNNTNIYINLNEFGNEDLSHISEDRWKQIVNRRYNSMKELIKEIYTKNDSNRNIYISNPNNKYGMIYDGSDWMYELVTNIVNNILINNSDILEDYINNKDNKVDVKTFDVVNKVIDIIREDGKKSKRFKDEATVMLVNSKKNTKKYYETISGKKIKQ